jgi:hypothetical protein
MELTTDITRTAGILLLTIVAVEYGGLFMFAIHRGNREFTDSRKPRSVPVMRTRESS